MSSALNFETNGIEFDFPEYIGVPTCRYVIASSSRSGSNMLQRALWRSGKAGAPEEYFTPKYIADFSLRLSPGSLTASGNFDTQAYVSLLMRWRTSPNGAFGVKMHGDHLNLPALAGCDLEDLLGRPKYLRLQRRNRVRQAISYSLAVQTGVWILDGAWLADKAPNPQPPVYRYETILGCVKAIEREETEWTNYFRYHRIESCSVIYEDLTADYQAVMREVFRYLELTPPSLFAEPGIRAQSNAMNDEWYDRFLAEDKLGYSRVGVD